MKVHAIRRTRHLRTNTRPVRKGAARLGVETLDDRLLLSAGLAPDLDLAPEAPVQADLAVVDEALTDGDTDAVLLGKAFYPDRIAYDFQPNLYAVSSVSYMLHEHWGGDFQDAEKSADDFDDDEMCWAAAASNVLTWTGWGDVAGMTTADEVFEYMQDHWTDAGGFTQYAWMWWFDGVARVYGWSSIPEDPSDVGGGFFPSLDIYDYYHYESNPELAMEAIDEYLHNGWGVTLDLGGPNGHAVTCWGYNYDPSNPDEYHGVWITDSDDNMYDRAGTDELKYVQIEFVETSWGGDWYLRDYNGSDLFRITDVRALEPRPFWPMPEMYMDISKFLLDDADKSGVQELDPDANKIVYVAPDDQAEKTLDSKTLFSTQKLTYGLSTAEPVEAASTADLNEASLPLADLAVALAHEGATNDSSLARPGAMSDLCNLIGRLDADETDDPMLSVTPVNPDAVGVDVALSTLGAWLVPGIEALGATL